MRGWDSRRMSENLRESLSTKGCFVLLLTPLLLAGGCALVGVMLYEDPPPPVQIDIHGTLPRALDLTVGQRVLVVHHPSMRGATPTTTVRSTDGGAGDLLRDLKIHPRRTRNNLVLDLVLQADRAGTGEIIIKTDPDGLTKIIPVTVR